MPVINMAVRHVPSIQVLGQQAACTAGPEFTCEPAAMGQAKQWVLRPMRFSYARPAVQTNKSHCTLSQPQAETLYRVWNDVPAARGSANTSEKLLSHDSFSLTGWPVLKPGTDNSILQARAAHMEQLFPITMARDAPGGPSEAGDEQQAWVVHRGPGPVRSVAAAEEEAVLHRLLPPAKEWLAAGRAAVEAVGLGISSLGSRFDAVGWGGSGCEGRGLVPNVALRTAYPDDPTYC